MLISQNFQRYLNHLNKSFFFTLTITLLLPVITNAQTGQGISLKGSLNYNANVDYFVSINNNSKNTDRNIGYHIGLFEKIGDKVYLKPEVSYTSAKSSYDNDSFKMQKLDTPIFSWFKNFRTY